jgi:arylsulfatase A-like enzyme
MAGVVARQGAAIGAAFALVAAFARASPDAPVAVAREVAAGTGLGVLAGLGLLLLAYSSPDPRGTARTTSRLGATLVALFSTVVTLRRWHALAEGTPREPSVVGALLTALLLLLLWRALVHAADRNLAYPTAALWFPLGVLGAVLAHKGFALDPRWGGGWPLRSALQNLVLVAATAAAAVAAAALTARARSATRRFPRMARYARGASWLVVGAGLVGLVSGPGALRPSRRPAGQPAAKRDDGLLKSPSLGSQVLVKLGSEVRAAVAAPSPSDLSYALPGVRSIELAWGTGVPVRETTAHFRAVLKANGGRSHILLEDTVTSTDESRPQWLTKTVAIPDGMNDAELLLQTRGTSRKAFWAAPVLLRGPVAGETRPNVIIVSLDTLGASHVGAYGYSRRPTTPDLDAWAREGTLFESAWSTAPGTLSSQMSILTGRYPSAQGVSYARWRQTGSIPSLPEDVPTLPEVLAARGFLTAAFTGSGYFALPVGYSRGFREYVSTDDRTHGSAVNVFEKAFDWLERRRDQPFFLFLHTYEAHAPYQDDRFLSREGSRAHDANTRNDALYDGDIRRADTYMGALRRTLDRLGLGGRTFVIVLSDHGEEFGGHFDVWDDGHGHSLYEEITHVPLVVLGPKVARGRRVKGPVDLTAVAPTVLGLLGIEPPEGMRGRRLAPVLRGGPETGEQEWTAFSEDVWIGPARRAVRTEAYKLVERGEDLPERFVVNDQRRAIQKKVLALPAQMLFHLPSDPGERKNLVAEQATEALRLRQLLSARFSAAYQAGSESGEIAVEGDALERLRALGYLK